MDIQRRFPPILSRSFLIALLAAAASDSNGAGKQKFYPDDPVWTAPKPVSLGEIKPRKTDALYDFLYNSFEPKPATIPRAGNVNTLGEVPDSEWYTNRHGRKRMTIDALRHGPGDANPPRPPYSIVGAKLDGITPGFQMRDAAGRLYFIKPDPMSAPEMATAADAIGTRFFYALGYFTPENYIVDIDPKDVQISPEGTTNGANGKPRAMRRRDVDKVLWKIPRTKDGRYRFLASKAVDGKPIGPFRYEGTRSDDPNDVVPHEHRRELRGLHVFCAWLNHTDAKSGNSLDAVVEKDGVRFVRHYLIDFGAIFGSDSDMVKNARFGNEYIIPEPKPAFKEMVSFGLKPKPWETAETPKIRGVGRFQAESFDPETWVSNFPNRAFLHRLPDDEYWAAKQVMAFTDAEIRAIVETGRLSDPRAVDYITKTLIERRNRIGKAYFTKVLAVDKFAVHNGRLEFSDLAVESGFAPKREYQIAWNRLDNASGALTPIGGASGPSLPSGVRTGDYVAAVIHQAGDPAKKVTVFLRSRGGNADVVGIERTW